MRKTLILITVLIAVSVGVQADPYYVSTGVVANPEADIARAEQLNTWMYETVTYVGLTPLYVQTPGQTFMKGGDCADQSAALILFLSAIHMSHLLVRPPRTLKSKPTLWKTSVEFDSFSRIRPMYFHMAFLPNTT